MVFVGEEVSAGGNSAWSWWGSTDGSSRRNGDGCLLNVHGRGMATAAAIATSRSPGLGISYVEIGVGYTPKEAVVVLLWW